LNQFQTGDDFIITGSVGVAPAPGGFTTWSGGAGTWSNGTAGQFGGNYANDLANVVTFEGAGATVTASGTPQAGSLFFDSTGYTLSGAVQLGVGSITTNGAISTTISANISGNGSSGLTKAGVGSLLLSGSNSYTGTTTLNAGVLTIGNANALGSSGDITFSGGTLQYGTGNTTDFSSRIKGSGSAIIIDTNNNNVTFATALAATNTGGLTKQGTGTLTLSVNNTLTGPLQVTGGTLSLSSGTLSINTASASTISGTLSGSGSLTKQGAGTLTITNNNSGYSGETRLEAGVLEIGNNGALGTGTIAFRAANSTFRSTDATDRTLSNAIGTFTGGTGTVYTFGSVGTGNLTFSGTGSTSIGTAGRVINVLNTVTSFGQSFTSTGSITKTGDGTMILTGASTYNGSTTINAGTLQIGNGGTTGSLNATSTITNNATLVFNRSDALTQGTNFSTAAITGTGSIIKNGTGNLILNSANTYMGATMVNNGTLALGSTGSIASSSVLKIASGATFDVKAKSGSFTLNNPLTIDVGAANAGKLDAEGVALIYGNTLTLNITASTPFSYDLFDYTSGSFTGNITLGGLYSGSMTGNAGVWTASSNGYEFSFAESTGVLQATTAAIPEPGTWVLVGIGATFFLYRMRSRKSSVS
jgi:autotransporter-associated beta strand protein